MMMNKMKRAAWALLLTVALVLTPAMAEGVSADLVEAPAEEAGELLLDMSVPEEATVQTVPKEAPASEPVEAVSKANYEPATYTMEVSKNISGTLYIGDTLDLRFTAGAFKTIKSETAKVAELVSSDPTSGTARVRALKEGKSKIVTKLNNGKKVTVTVNVKDPYEVTDISLGSDFTVNVGDTVQLKPTLTPATGRTTLKWSVSDKKVATVSDAGLVTGVKEGKTKITVRTANGEKDTVYVKVVDPYKPEAVSISNGDITVNIGDTVTLKPVLNPATARTTYTWSTSRKKTATVSEAGVVKAEAEGTAKITVKTANGKKATITVKVVDAYKPQSVALADVTIGEGDTLNLQPVLTPATARTTYTWSTSKKKVATVSSTGEVKGVKEGTAKITVKTANGKKATCTVTVQKNSQSEAKYRALLVANDDFYFGEWERGSLNRSAANKLKKALDSVKGAEGGRIAVTTKLNVMSAQLFTAINQTFAGADENDVSIFYIATHGDATASDSFAGAVMMASQTETYPEYVTLGHLSSALAAVPGKVIVILDTCGSGAGVYMKGAGSARSTQEKACADFDAAVVKAFSDADPGVVVSNDGEVIAKTGELRRENKFYVLTSSRYHEESWAYNNKDGGGSYFTDWLTEGIGKSGSMPADKKYSGNKDGAADLHELYSYVSNVGDNKPISYGGRYVYQHVQVYPSNTRYLIFK